MRPAHSTKSTAQWNQPPPQSRPSGAAVSGSTTNLQRMPRSAAGRHTRSVCDSTCRRLSVEWLAEGMFTVPVPRRSPSAGPGS